ncbi:hypothetical protein HYH02_012739 [Chlamydomonas schloesseri]|uniref:Uncharacterized protein n=1 Tax=Chlamydomonas schloesseri TaxID=2026947 RepID=A0A835VXQ7_9CHLO|nr:hypothetical protein HYH02_012739 [Chlamydomonas schloesseri]|eukprot:KAG2433197.1 hypothetical protein HYH02_012739 [Chlamydomonas schloesseri]
MANAGLALVSHAASALQRLVYGLEAGVLQPGDVAPAAAAAAAYDVAGGGPDKGHTQPGPVGSTTGGGTRRTVSQLRSQLAEQLTSAALAVAVSDVVRACHMAPPPPPPMSLPLSSSTAAGLAATGALRCGSCGGDVSSAPGSRSSGGASSASCSPCSCSSTASPASSCSPRSASPRASLEAARAAPASGGGGTEGCSSGGGAGGCSEDRSAEPVGWGSRASSSAAALLVRARRACSGHASVASVLGIASDAVDASGVQGSGGCGVVAAPVGPRPHAGPAVAAPAAAPLLSTPHGACVLGRSSRYLYLLLWCAHDSAAATGPSSTEEPPPDAAPAAGGKALAGAEESSGVLLRLVAALEESQLVEALCAAYLDTPAPAPAAAAAALQPLPPQQQQQQQQLVPPYAVAVQPEVALQAASSNTAASARTSSVLGRALTQKELRKQQQQQQQQQQSHAAKGRIRGAKALPPAARSAHTAQHTNGPRRAGAMEVQDDGPDSDPHAALLCSLRHGLSSLAHATSLLATLASSLNASAGQGSGRGGGYTADPMDGPRQQPAGPAAPAPMALRAGRLLLAPSAQRLQLSLLRHLCNAAGLPGAVGGTAMDTVEAPRCRELLDAVYPALSTAPPAPPPPPAPQNSRSGATASAKPGSRQLQRPQQQQQHVGGNTGSQGAEAADVAGEMAARAARDLALLPQLQPALLGWATLERLGLGGELEAAMADGCAQWGAAGMTTHVAGLGGGGGRISPGSGLGASVGARGHRYWAVPEDEVWGLAAPQGAPAGSASDERPWDGSSGGAGAAESRRGPLHLEATAAAAQALCRLLRGDCGPPPSPVLLKHVAPLDLVADILQGAMQRLSGHSPSPAGEHHHHHHLSRRPLPLYGHGITSSSSGRSESSTRAGPQPGLHDCTSLSLGVEGQGAALSCAVPAAWEALAWAAAVQATEAGAELAAGGRGSGPVAFAGAQPAALQRLARIMELCVALVPRSAVAQGGGPEVACGAGHPVMPSREEQEAGQAPAREADQGLAARLSQARWAATLNACLRLASCAAAPLAQETGQQGECSGPQMRLGRRLRDVVIELVSASPEDAMWAPKPRPCSAAAAEAAAMAEVETADLSALLLTLGQLAAAAGRQVCALAEPAAAAASPLRPERTGRAPMGQAHAQPLTAACEHADRLLAACDAAARAGTAALRASNGGALTLAPLRGSAGGNGTKGPACGSTAAGLPVVPLELLRGAVAACLRCGCGAAAQRLQASHALLFQSRLCMVEAEHRGTTEAEVAAAHATVWCRWLALPLAGWLHSRQGLMPARPLELLAACRGVLTASPGTRGCCAEVDGVGSSMARTGAGKAEAVAASAAGAAVCNAVMALVDHPGLGEEVRCAWLDTTSATCGAAAGAAAATAVTPLARLLEALGVSDEQAAAIAALQLDRQQRGSLGAAGAPSRDQEGCRANAPTAAADAEPQKATFPAASAAAPVSAASPAAGAPAIAVTAPDVEVLLCQARRLTQLLRSPSVSSAFLGVEGRARSVPPSSPVPQPLVQALPPAPAVPYGAIDSEREPDAGMRSGSTSDTSRFDSCARYHVAHAAALARARDVSSR